MEKMDGMSMDLKAENIAQLKTLFPEAVTEGKVDFEVLKALLGGEIEQRQEYYKFTWNGKEAARAYAQTRSMGTLRPCMEESSGKDGTPGKFDSDNLYIEGDNLEVLKLLQGPYHKRVKMIYIDPPYNTGRDFVYPDNYKDSIGNYKALTGQTDGEGKSTRANPETSGRYHTDWLNMMYPRLILARNLLADEGVIFISIDENEQENLKKLCNDVFGEENFINNVSVKMSELSGLKMKHVNKYPKLKENIIIYAKNSNCLSLEIEKKPKDLKTLTGYLKYYSNIIADKNMEDIDPSQWQIMPLKDYWEACGLEFSSDEEINDWKLANAKRMIYRTNSKTVDRFLQNNPDAPAVCAFLNDDEKRIVKWDDKEMLFLCDYTEEYLGDMWTDISTINLNKEIEEVPFDAGQKPLSLLTRILKSVNLNNSIVLDFFSGSATTAHAVQQLNAEDGGNRKYIMVQLPEVCEAGTEAAKAGYANICEIGKERIRRAAKKIKGEHPNWNGDMGFKVFKLDTSNLLPWNPNADELKQNLFAAVDNVLDGRTTDDLLHEILLKCNLPLTLPIETKQCGSNTIYLVGAGALAICLDKNIPATIAEEIVRLRDEYAPIVPMQVVFRDNGFNDVTKTNALQILKQAGFEEKSIQTI